MENEHHDEELRAYEKLRAKVARFDAKQPDRAIAEARAFGRRETKTDRFTVKCLPSWKRRLTSSAATLGMSAAEVIEAAVNEYLARRAAETGGV